jgi:hypothetical protein
VGVGDDAAFGRLTELLGQAHHRHGIRINDIGKHLARADRRQLDDVTDE